MMNEYVGRRFLCHMMALGMALLICASPAAAAEKPKATAKQTEGWLEQHIVAWDDDTQRKVSVSECRMRLSTRGRSRVINFTGVLFPVEIIAKGKSQDPYVRLRVKNRYSGDYGMSRDCSSQNEWCEENVGKWSPLSYHDFRITNVVQYVGRDEDLNVSKATQLRDALEHYAQLCNAKAYDFRF